jgi:diguanylate cyclase (GGDEF)-like protein
MRKKNRKHLKTTKGLVKSRHRKASSKLAYPAHLNENEVIEELKLTVQKLRTFDALGKTLTSSLELSQVIQNIVQQIGSLVKCEHVSLVLHNPTIKRFCFEYPDQGDKKAANSFEAGEGILGSCLEVGRGELIHDSPKKDPRYNAKIDGRVFKDAKSMMTIPIITRGNAIGVLALATDNNHASFTNEDLQMVETFSDYISIAIDNSLNFNQVRELTIQDDVTRLYNSRYLQLVLERELARSNRYGDDLSIVFIDIDDFKKVNDSNGHLYGSELLKEFGEFMIECLRTSDVAIRYGGDEFILVLPSTNKENSLRTVNRILTSLRSHNFLESKGKKIKMTASFGIASFGDDGKTMHELIEAADKAMYYVKRGAKNSVYTANRPATLAGTHSK